MVRHQMVVGVGKKSEQSPPLHIECAVPWIDYNLISVIITKEAREEYTYSFEEIYSNKKLFSILVDLEFVQILLLW